MHDNHTAPRILSKLSRIVVRLACVNRKTLAIDGSEAYDVTGARS